MAYRKYRAKKVVVDDIKFDSKKEAGRYIQLKELEEKGAISDLHRQVPFLLVPAQFGSGEKKKGKCLERAVRYVADFTYHDNVTNEDVVEDVKGVKTPEYVIKRKLMLYFFNVKIREV